MLGGAGFFFLAAGRGSSKEGEKKVIGEMNPEDHWFPNMGDAVQQFVSTVE